MKMTIPKARATFTATTLVFCLFFSDTVKALKGKGGDCSSPSEVCEEGLYCVQEEHFIDAIGMENGPNKMCVECLSDYDCPSSISCTNPLTPLAMCDWGAQKTFPGIDNIRKGYNGLKSDPLLYKDSMDPGWETEGFIFDYDYMKGATSFTFNDELFDVPFGHWVDVEESCSFNMQTDTISTTEKFDAEVSKRVTKRKGSENSSSEIAKGGRAYFSSAKSKSETTSNTEATCSQYIVELDMKKLSDMKLDSHLIAFLEEQESRETFNYKALFDKKGTHFVTKAWLGSKFGMTNTITEENMQIVQGSESDYKKSATKSVEGRLTNKENSVSGSNEQSVSLEKYSDTMNTFSIGSSNVASLEDWAESSKENPEIVRMEVESICTLLANFKDVLLLFEDPDDPLKPKEKYTKFDEDECSQGIRAYSNQNSCYDISVKTCDQSSGGTNSELYLSIYGELHSQNIIGIYLNDKVSATDAFEQGDTDSLRICGETTVGTIKEIGLRGDRSDTWKPEWVSINGRIFNYHCRAIDDQEEKAVPTNGLKTYNIRIETCSTSSAGTDAGVYLYLYGDVNTNPSKFLGEQYLNDLIDGNAFEQGKADNLQLVDKAEIGEITKIGVTGASWDIWKPLKITVDDKVFNFNCQEVSGSQVYSS